MSVFQVHASFCKIAFVIFEERSGAIVNSLYTNLIEKLDVKIVIAINFYL